MLQRIQEEVSRNPIYDFLVDEFKYKAKKGFKLKTTSPEEDGNENLEKIDTYVSVEHKPLKDYLLKKVL